MYGFQPSPSLSPRTVPVKRYHTSLYHWMLPASSAIHAMTGMALDRPRKCCSLWRSFFWAS